MSDELGENMKNGVPKGEERCDAARLVPFVPYEEILAVVDLPVLAARAEVRGNILFAHGKCEGKTP